MTTDGECVSDLAFDGYKIDKKHKMTTEEKVVLIDSSSESHISFESHIDNASKEAYLRYLIDKNAEISSNTSSEESYASES